MELVYNLQLFSDKDIVTYDSLPDEIITDVRDNIEKYVESQAYWSNFAHTVSVKKGAKKMSYRRLVKPDIRPEDIKEMAELVAPRPSKIAVVTFEKSIKDYGGNAEYTAQDMRYHKDDTVSNIRYTLREEAKQTKDLIIGKAFVNSRAIITYTNSILDTLGTAAIVLRKNDAARWANNLYLVHVTPEEWTKLKAEVRALGQSLDEKTKININGKEQEFSMYGDFMFSISTSKVLYKDNGKQVLVIQGRRGIDNESGVEVSKLSGEPDIEFGDNGLGKGVIKDESGNIVADKNKQKGSCYYNIIGLGATISDDLVVLNCEVPIAEVAGSKVLLAERTGYVSTSPTSSMTIKVVDEKGVNIETPTITVKKNNAKGDAVSATSGTTYPVTAGDKYLVTATKASYNTATVTIPANAGDNTYFVVLTKTA